MLTLGKTDKEVCMPSYYYYALLSHQRATKGPLFITEIHNYLTKQMFHSSLTELLQQAG